jgi:hypothetical protein
VPISVVGRGEAVVGYHKDSAKWPPSPSDTTTCWKPTGRVAVKAVATASPPIPTASKTRAASARLNHFIDSSWENDD